MAEYVNTVESFKLFLEYFLKHEQPTDETPHPFHPQSSTVAEHEIEGEILDWALTILEQCPDFLKFSIAREVVKTIFYEGLEQYKAEIKISTGSEKLDEDKKEQNDTTDHVATYFSTAALAKATFLTVYKVCAKWHKELPDFKVPPLNVYSAHGIKNTRRKMEDKHTVITNLNALLDLKDDRHTQYYAVFDGHGGLDASIYASKHLHVMLSRQETFSTDVEEALKKSILELDAEYCKKSERDSLRSGTTAVIAVIRENVLYIAWIGDSQTVLIRDGQEVQLMDPHKPDRPDEKQRIEDLGGCVIWFGAWRVNGTLSVSRAIGDAEFKPFVSGDADTYKKELNDTDDYLCIACDGLWDVFNGKQLAQLVSQHMQETGDKSSLSRVLCAKAKDAGSSDNITVLIVFFKDVITIVKEETANTQEAVENDDEEIADSSDSPESKPDVPNGDSTAVESKMAEDQDSSKPDSSSVDPPVIVQGSKLQPGVKERPPHKLFVNKPQGLVPKVNVLVTDTAPHAKLPHSVVTHKPHWQKSPVMERRDTRGSLFSLSTVESEEITMPLTFGAENRLNVNGLNTQSGLPVIMQAQRERRHSPVRNTPSPSVMSEPAIPGEGFVVLHYPSKPSPQRHSKTRKTYRTSIIMNHTFMDDASDAGILGYQRPKLLRRASRSLPDHLNRLSKTLHLSQWPGSRSHHRFGQSHPNSNFPVKSPQNGFHKENIVPLGFPNAVYGTEIAITNSLYNKIKPKRNAGRKMSSNSMRYHEELPVQLPYRWQKN